MSNDRIHNKWEPVIDGVVEAKNVIDGMYNSENYHGDIEIELADDLGTLRKAIDVISKLRYAEDERLHELWSREQQ